MVLQRGKNFRRLCRHKRGWHNSTWVPSFDHSAGVSPSGANTFGNVGAGLPSARAFHTPDVTQCIAVLIRQRWAVIAKACCTAFKMKRASVLVHTKTVATDVHKIVVVGVQMTFRFRFFFLIFFFELPPVEGDGCCCDVPAAGRGTDTAGDMARRCRCCV
jgi:hypothetical protein